MDMKFVSFPFRPAFADTVKALKIDSELEDEFRDIYEKCIAVARPKAVFCLVPVHQEGGETVIGTERFKSRIMQVNLQAVRRAFPYAVSCGRELYDLARSMEDELDRWWVDSFSQYSMRAVDAEMTRALKETYHLGHMARMNPGSLLVSKLSIRDICDAVGYEEQSCFIKVFTRFTGVTPGKFRKRGGRLDSSKERDTTAQ